MSYTQSTGLDEIDWHLLDELNRDARLSLSELARRVHLSRPAVGERLRRLEDSGVIRGYTAVIDPTRVGFPVVAVVRIRSRDPGGQSLRIMLDRLPEVVECRHVSGEDCFYLLVWSTSIPDLERITATLAEAGHTTTSIVFSTLVNHRLPTHLENTSCSPARSR